MFYVIITFVLLISYWVPTIAAYQRKKENAGVILLINLLTGWTIIGWLVALSMAYSESHKVIINNSKSNAEELEKLFSLKEKGIITDEEYKSEKEKLIK